MSETDTACYRTISKKVNKLGDIQLTIKLTKKMPESTDILIMYFNILLISIINK